MTLKFISFILAIFLMPLFGWTLDTTRSVVLKDGSQAIIRPLTGDPEDLKRLQTILKDADTCKTMRDGTLWPDESIKNTYAFYVTNWQVFNDLQSLGLKNPSLTFGFLVVSSTGKIMGFGGIQNSTRKEPYKELYFAFLPPYRNKGLGKQFGKFLITFHEYLYGKQILEAIILPDNIPSKTLFGKLGFLPRLDSKGNHLSHSFPRWGGRVYQIYRYTPTTTK
ncbi:MAG: GNAT family N-acetyltransferase; N-acetyltransferase [Alphaproteobacteria bacterium]